MRKIFLLILVPLFASANIQDFDCKVIDLKNIEKLEYCANIGDVLNQYNLGIIYRDGIGVSRDFNKSFYWFNQAAKQELPQALINLSWFYKNGVATDKDYEKAFSYSQKAVNLGYQEGWNNIGSYYQNGIGVKINLIKAFDAYKKAADTGLPIAKVNLANAYFYGLGTQVNQNKAISLLKEIAQKGDLLAMNNLGLYYQETNDYLNAFMWIKKAAENNFSLAQSHLGFFYGKGVGVRIDKNNAIYWLNKGVESGDSQALYYYGLFYSQTPSILELNLSKAFDYYKRAADLNNRYAQNNLGFWYLNGKYVTKDVIKAIEFYEKAAKQGLPQAMYSLYQIYSEGDDKIASDPDKAKYWLNKSREYGFKP